MARMTRMLFAFLAATGLVVGTVSAAQHAIKQTALSLTRIYINDSTGEVHLVDSTGKDISVKKWTEAVSGPKIAGDRITAGWLLEERAGTSYTVPTALAIYRSGKVLRTLAPSDWPIIVAWAFFAGGKQVGLSSTALHGAESERRSYELHDVQTGRLLESWDDHDQHSGKPPAWVEDLR